MNWLLRDELRDLKRLVRRHVARDNAWPCGVWLAIFADPATLEHAVKELRRGGYVRVESYTPYHLTKVSERLGYGRSLLPVLICGGGLFGGVASWLIQWYTNAVSFPLNIGGRPANAVPAFVVPTFEGTVLMAALTAFFGLWFVLRLPRPWHPIFEIDGFDRVSNDSYWLMVDAADPRAADPPLTAHELWALEPERVIRVEPESS